MLNSDQLLIFKVKNIMDTYTEQQEVLQSYLNVILNKEEDLLKELNFIQTTKNEILNELEILEPKVQAEKLLKT